MSQSASKKSSMDEGKGPVQAHRLVLDEVGSRGELDWSRCAIDPVNMRALKKGGLAGPNPVDQGKYGSKTHLITERTGLPLSVGTQGQTCMTARL
ncbi:hypothetical protein SAMN06272775_1650 [Streptomyces sp. 2323.1]|nr:hypothetical protein SAMN06272775_1650 [Streptomyces sp. 2323.1]